MSIFRDLAKRGAPSRLSAEHNLIDLFVIHIEALRQLLPRRLIFCPQDHATKIKKDCTDRHKGYFLNKNDEAAKDGGLFRLREFFLSDRSYFFLPFAGAFFAFEAEAGFALAVVFFSGAVGLFSAGFSAAGLTARFAFAFCARATGSALRAV